MDWNAELYDNKHGYVAEYGKGLLEYIPNNKGQIILDLGCGTGSLTSELSKKAEKVIGIDGSATMIQQAKNLYPAIDFQVMDACHLIWNNYFDVIFSNAVFHWIENQETLLERIYGALNNGGSLICEFGAAGNINKIQTVFQAVMKKYEYHSVNPFYFPSKEEYEERLKQNGFQIKFITDFDRPTPLKDGDSGLRNWVTQFFAKDLVSFSKAVQHQIFEEMEALLKTELWDGQQWIADYRRIRVVASKQ